ncbi:MAG: RNHCP domain-containing protein [Deltaproteobacteria bacterium]|nr:RNHCP domain-containing protein [Deltaproteobacteria bacterium]MBW2253289.1 RNHCP domain-containing protein [Deltaproteobacteria bacterium]
MTWIDPGGSLQVRAEALLDATAGASRGEVKRLGRWLDEAGDEALRAALIELGCARGVEIPEEARSWPGKRLLRLCRGQEAPARERRNPIRRDEGFTCDHCSAEVPPHGRTARDHCPFCLRSLHVDEVPGDRAARCGGVLDPVALEMRGDRPIILYRCRRCGAERVNQALLDGLEPDRWEQLSALSGKGPS